MLKARKKTNNLGHIAYLYNLKWYICLHGTFLKLKNS